MKQATVSALQQFFDANLNSVGHSEAVHTASSSIMSTRRRGLQFATKHLNDKFDDVIGTDEATVQCETQHRFCCRKRKEAPIPKPGVAVL